MVFKKITNHMSSKKHKSDSYWYSKEVQDLNLPIRIDKLINISGILTAVNNLNLPIRIDELDANISGILTAINNLNLPIHYWQTRCKYFRYTYSY
jgi:hypothetical protein